MCKDSEQARIVNFDMDKKESNVTDVTYTVIRYVQETLFILCKNACVCYIIVIGSLKQRTFANNTRNFVSSMETSITLNQQILF